ncbi:MAG: putative metal-binding motif-containing protein [Deltaproteobacteria bacterium]|nr:putative metal-binding motif-containing protein [Deltaproteobacteria bacterium]
MDTAEVQVPVDVADVGPPWEVPVMDAPGEAGCVDLDRDGFPATACGGMPPDCDDGNPMVRPGAAEVCDRAGLDEDCDPCTVAGTADGDGDRDTFLSALCENRYLGATPTCGMTVRVRAGRVAGPDCDDTNGNVRPNQAEVCNSLDDNCDGAIDEGVQRTFTIDRDRDRFGDSAMGAVTRVACAAPPGFVDDRSDCDDSNPLVNPGSREVCDEGMRDENCDGTPNESCPCVAGTSSGMPCCAGRGQLECVMRPTGGSEVRCNAVIGTEVCNGADDDCDGMTDEGCICTPGTMRPCYEGAEGTAGRGACRGGSQTCAVVGTGTASWSTCVGQVLPGPEVCDTLDNDCDGAADEGVTSAYYPDRDSDGFGDQRASPEALCRGRAGLVENNHADCDDANPLIHPAAREVCDAASADENCNGTANEVCDCAPLGMVRSCCATRGMQTCLPGGTGASWGPCSVLAAPEVCDGVDNNCDGTVDEGTRLTCFVDADGDGFAPASARPEQLCPAIGSTTVCPGRFTPRAPGTAPDCNDTPGSGAAIFPGATELCTPVNENCDPLGRGYDGPGFQCELGQTQGCPICPGSLHSDMIPSGNANQPCVNSTTNTCIWGTCAFDWRPGQRRLWTRPAADMIFRTGTGLCGRVEGSVVQVPRGTSPPSCTAGGESFALPRGWFSFRVRFSRTSSSGSARFRIRTNVGATEGLPSDGAITGIGSTELLNVFYMPSECILVRLEIVALDTATGGFQFDSVALWAERPP